MGRHLPAEHRSCGVVRYGYQTLPSPTGSVVPESAGQNIFSPIRFPHQRDCMGCLERQSSSCGFNDDLWLSTNARSPQLKFTTVRCGAVPARPAGTTYLLQLPSQYIMMMPLPPSSRAKLSKKSRLVIPLNLFLLYAFPDIFVTDNYRIYIHCIFKK